MGIAGSSDQRIPLGPSEALNAGARQKVVDQQLMLPLLAAKQAIEVHVHLTFSQLVDAHGESLLRFQLAQVAHYAPEARGARFERRDSFL